MISSRTTSAAGASTGLAGRGLLGVMVLAWAALSIIGCAHAPSATPAAHAAEVAAPPPSAAPLQLFEPLPGLLTSGQPAPQDWAQIRARGVTTVINLRTPGELAGRDEKAEVEAVGMRYIDIPVAHADGINGDNARLLHDALAPSHGRGVLVHCATGNRAGSLLALEQRDFDGLAPQAALELGRKAGVTRMEPVLKKALGITP